MPTSGRDSGQNGDYDWSVVAFGTEDRWYERSPSEATIRDHIGDPDWRMVIHVDYADGDDLHFTIYGGIDPDDLGDYVAAAEDEY